MCHDVSGGTHQILIRILLRKLNDIGSQMHPLMVFRNGPENSDQKFLEQKKLSGSSLLSNQKYWPEPKDEEIEKIKTFPYDGTSSCNPATFRHHCIPTHAASSEKPAVPTNRERVLCGVLAFPLESVHVC